MSREPVTRAPIPTAPPLFPLAVQLLLGFGAFLVLFVLPPCASSPVVDLAVLGGLALWATWIALRCLHWPRRRPARLLPPRIAPPPDEVPREMEATS